MPQLLGPALHGPPSLYVQLRRCCAVFFRIHGGELFDDGPGKADLRHGAHGHAAATQCAAQRVLIRRNGQTQAGTGLGKGEGPALGGRPRVCGHQNDPRLFGPGGGAHRLLADLHTARLFGNAQQGQYRLDHTAPPPICASSAS